VADDDLVTRGEADRLLEERARGDRRRGVVRIVEPQELRAPRDLVGDGAQVGEEAVLATQRHAVRDAAVEVRPDVIDRVARVGHQHDVARIDEGDRHVGDALLRADERDHLRGRVEPNAVAALHPPRRRLAKGGEALVVGVAMVLRVARRLAEAGDDVRRGGRVRVADAQVDEIDPARRHFPLQAVDLGEEIGRKALDSLGFFDRDRQAGACLRDRFSESVRLLQT